MKTIRQIADEIGVSKQAVHKKMKKEPLSTKLTELTSTVDGVIHISVDGEKLIKSAFEEKEPSTVAVNQPSTVDSEVVALLRENLAVLQGQLTEKDNQIDHLQAELAEERRHGREQADKLALLADTAQRLHAGTIKQIEGGEAPADERDGAPPTVPPKRGFFGKFRKK